VRPQLFYHLTDPGGAAARRLVVALDLLEQFKFRNLTYDEVRQDLERLHAEHGGGGALVLPALWDGQRLHQGEAAVLAAIRALRPDAG
jgi:hypothetical protein